MKTNLVAKLVIDDILDEVSEDLRHDLLTNGGVSTTKVAQCFLSAEIRRLRADLKFAEKCLIVLNEYKRFVNDVRDRLEDRLSDREKCELTALEDNYRLMVDKIRQRNRDKERQIGLGKGSEADPDEEQQIGEDEHVLDLCGDSSDEEYVPNGKENKVDNKCRNNPLTTDIKVEAEPLRNKRKRKRGAKSDILFEFLYLCEECFFQTNDRSRFESHVKSHLKRFCPEYKWTDLFCEICEQHFDDKTLLREHFRRHHSPYGVGFRQVPCLFPNCGRMFRHKNSLTLHVKQHLSEGGQDFFGCSHTDCDFKDRDCNVVKRHELRKHTLPESRPFKCRYLSCGSNFRFVSDFERHISVIHLLGFRFLCPLCQIKFKYGNTIKNHMCLRHDIEVEDVSEYRFESSISPDLRLEKFYKCIEGLDWMSTSKPGLKTKAKVEVKEEDNMAVKIEPSSFHMNHSFCCQECDAKPNTKEELDAHVLECHASFVVPLHIDFVNEVEVIDNHEILAIEETPNQVKSSVSKVTEISRVNRWKKRRAVRCDQLDCNVKMFTGKATYERHMYFYHTFAKPVFRCEKCPFESQELANARLHMKLHKSNKPFVCPVCLKKFSSVTVVRQHIPLHSDHKGLPCATPGCESTFKNDFQRKKHHREIHIMSGKKRKRKLSCDWPGCDYTTQQTIVLKHHKYIHTGERPYKCTWPKCNKRYANSFIAVIDWFLSFRQFDVCQDHMMRHELKQLKCDHPGCERMFYKQNMLDRHKNSVHEHKYPCDWPGCEFVGRNNYILKHHKYIHTGERPYKCTWPECDKRFDFSLIGDWLISV